MLLSFNGLLRAADICASRVRLVRHAGKRQRLGGRSAFQLWQQSPSAFEEFQAIQKNHRLFGAGDIIASFVATPSDETLFVGLFDVAAVSRLDVSRLNYVHGDGSFTKDDEDSFVFHHLQACADYHDLRGRLVVDWGAGTRCWVQRAQRQNKDIVEVRRAGVEPHFPGFDQFRSPLSDLNHLPASWQQALRAVKGVYLLTCQHCGKSYVGSASGEQGLWGRMSAYANTGHGGNVELRKHCHNAFEVSVLEVIDAAAPRTRLLAREQAWKQKLRTRDFGLNLN